jgi:hypothetical protein
MTSDAARHTALRRFCRKLIIKDLQTCKREESNWAGADWRKNNLGISLKQEFSDPIGEDHQALVDALGALKSRAG